MFKNHIKYYIIFIILIAIINCQKPKGNSYEGSQIKNFYNSYEELIIMGKNTSLNDVLNQMSKKDSDYIKKLLIDYNESNTDWLAKFDSPPKHILILNKDGSLYLNQKGTEKPPSLPSDNTPLEAEGK